MATTTYKILGQSASNAFATTPVTIYTVPTGKQAVVSTIAVASLDSAVRYFSIGIVRAGNSWTNSPNDFTFAYQTPIPANSTITFTCGITLGAGDSIRAAITATGAYVGFHAYGSEITP